MIFQKIGRRSHSDKTSYPTLPPPSPFLLLPAGFTVKFCAKRLPAGLLCFSVKQQQLTVQCCVKKTAAYCTMLCQTTATYCAMLCQATAAYCAIPYQKQLLTVQYCVKQQMLTVQ